MLAARRLLLVTAIVLAALLTAPHCALARQWGSLVRPLGPQEPVFANDFDPNAPPEAANSKNSCDGGHIPDLPAKAFRDNQNRIEMQTPNGEVPRVRTDGSITWQGSHRMLGSSLNNLKPEQQTTYPDRRLCTDPRSNLTHTNPYIPNSGNYAMKPAAIWPPPPGFEPWNPGNFHDREWIDSPWAIGDGQTVYALQHNNYQGWRELDGQPNTIDPATGNMIYGYDGCRDANSHPIPPGDATNCWYAAITLVKSADGGATYGAPNDWSESDPPFYSGPPNHLVASTPYRYEPGQGRQGIPAPTGIVKNGSFYYMLFRMQLPPDAPVGQQQRACAARTTNLADPKSWRGWDGNAADDSQGGFTVTFVNPYTYQFTSTDTPETHLCYPVDTPIFPRSLVYSRYYHQYMLIGDGPVNGVSGAYFALSGDLINWSPPQLIASAENSCDSVTYPSVIDDDDPAASSGSTERNFFQPDQKAYLYVNAACGQGRVRIPIKFRAMRWATGVADGCPGGFDGHTGTFTPTAARNFTGDPNGYLATSLNGATSDGYFDKEDYPSACGSPGSDALHEDAGNDVWYSGAFAFPSQDFNSSGKPVDDVTILRLGNATSAAGALSLRRDGKVHFVTDPSLTQSGDETELGVSSNAVSSNGCWHYIEVHQKIGDASTANELWIDSQKQTTVQIPVDNFHGAAYDHLRAGIVTTVTGAPFTLWTDEVGFGYVGPIPFNMCRGVGDPLP
jgi:hypothetical protein